MNRFVKFFVLVVVLFSMGKAQLINEAAYIPSQCYTKTEDKNGKVHNPCYACHMNSTEPNYTNDSDLQLSYDFPEYAQKNHWINLFKDRSKEVAKISDESILKYVRKSNYFGKNGELVLADTLKKLSKSWKGYTPDCYYNFDTEGFDKDNQGKDTGWRAFGYYPFLGTFWATNGSLDDVLIRLPMDFRMTKEGVYDREVYKINLLIVESLIKQKSIQTFNIDEKKYSIDLDKNNKLDVANQITFEYDPRKGKYMYYVGLAQKKGYKIAAGLYPKGTEFLHSVRYIDSDENDPIKMAARMKELRYAKKVNWSNYSQHQALAEEELKEAHDFPDRLETFIGDAERGVSNKRGWRYQGFIEDAEGALRPQSYEENLFCIGCHGALGVLTDSTFAYKRKFEHGTFQNGWLHWSQKNLKDIKEPKMPNDKNEYTFYLQQNHAGDEFRENDEVKEKFFEANGTLKNTEVKILHTDISHLLYPSLKRALQLNKAYKVIVDEQSFIYGRDATIKPVKNVHKELKEEQSTGVKEPITFH